MVVNGVAVVNGMVLCHQMSDPLWCLKILVLDVMPQEGEYFKGRILEGSGKWYTDRDRIGVVTDCRKGIEWDAVAPIDMEAPD